MSESCLFCGIATGTIPAEHVWADDQCVAFRDLHPQAPVHLLIIPREHIASHAHATADHTAVLGHLMSVAGDLARSQKLAEGYRLVLNTGHNGGQTVDHLHVHLLGGRAMGWPPG